VGVQREGRSSGLEGQLLLLPPFDKQIPALREAAKLLRLNEVGKTMGVVRLDPDTRKTIKGSTLSLIATIPENTVLFNPHPATRRPTGKGRTKHEYGIVLGISNRKKSMDRKQLHIAIRTMRHWRDTIYPGARLDEAAIISEFSGKQSIDKPLTDNEWERLILEAWDWIDSPTGTQGLIYKKDQKAILTLRGSRAYNRTTTKIGLRLFSAFAKDWEDKNNLLPTHAKKWWYNKKEPKDKADKVPRKRNRREQKEWENKCRKLRQEAYSVHDTIQRSEGLLSAAIGRLFPEPRRPTRNRE
jgi:hypothetical protein